MQIAAASRWSRPLKNARYEKFAQGLASGMSATDAYKEARYSPNGQNAARLTKNDNIEAQVAVIRKAGALGRASSG